MLFKTIKISSSTAKPTESDLDTSGSPLNVKYHIEVLGFQPNFNDISNKCEKDEAATDVQLTIIVRKLHIFEE